MNTDSSTDHLDPSQIKQYVAVGPSRNLSRSFDKKTFDKGFTLTTMFLFALWLVIVGLLIWMTFSVSDLPNPPSLLKTNPLPIPQNFNFGAVANASAGVMYLAEVHPQSSTDCEDAFYGPNCSREKHRSNYFSIGTPTTTIEGDVIRRFKSDGKSFNTNNNHNSCSTACDENSDCSGFLYDGITCTLLKGTITVPKNGDISYGWNADSLLYLKSAQDLQFMGRVFLSRFAFSMPPRYWLTKETDYYLQVSVGRVEQLHFAAQKALVAGPYTGLYRRHPFTEKDIPLLLSLGDNSESYIHYPGTEINLPPDWQYDLKKSPLYVVYIE